MIHFLRCLTGSSEEMNLPPCTHDSALRFTLFFFHFFRIVCSPDKTDTCSISNPKVNRILNKIAIRAISSFLFRIFTIKFPCTFVYAHTLRFFFCLSFSRAIWSLNFYWFGQLLLRSSPLFFFAMRKYKRTNGVSFVQNPKNLRLPLSLSTWS